MKYILLLLCLLFFSQIKAEEYKVIKLRWEPIEGAKSYVVQVSDTNTFENILYEEKTKDTKLELDYEPNYKFARFAGIDQNGIRGEFSDPLPVETRLATASRGGNYFFVSVSHVHWTSSAIENLVRLQNYGLLNQALLGGVGSYAVNGNLSTQVIGRAFELGTQVSSKSGLFAHRFAFKGVSAQPENGFMLNTNAAGLIYQSYSFDPLKLYLLRYNFKYFPLLSSSSKTLKGLGLQAGLNLQKESFDSNQTYFYVTPSIINPLAGFLPQKNEYRNETKYLDLGLSYQLELNKTHEIQLGFQLLMGNGNGSNQYSYWLVGGITLPNILKTTFEGKISGYQWNLGYTYNLNPKSGIRLFVESRTLNYSIESSKTTAKLTPLLPINNFGPHPTLRDNIQFLSIEYFYKF